MNLIDLRKSNLRVAEVGTVVITSAGFRFKLVSRDPSGKESWIDEASELTWHDKEDSTYTWDQACGGDAAGRRRRATELLRGPIR